MIKGVIFDLDGTVYRGDDEVPGAARFVQSLADRGIRYLFVTNRANRTPREIVTHLHGYHIPCTEEHILTTAQATARHLPKGSCYMIGEEGMRRELIQAGMTFTEEAPDYVIVSLDRTFNYDKLSKAVQLVYNGARFIASNPDKMLRLGDHIVPGTGALVAAIAAGSGVRPLIIGKPEPLIMRMALEQMQLNAGDVINVGDNVETDIPAGLRAGIRTAFILTGVSTRAHLADIDEVPTWIVENYAELECIIAHENR